MTRMNVAARGCEQGLIDRAAILDRFDGDEDLLREISSIFLSEYPSLLDEIRTAVDSGDPKGLERAAHSLKGSVSNFGASAATNAAYTLETMGRKQQMTQAKEALNELVLQLYQLRPELKELAANLCD
jgi:two-component system sensor histidine kinase/response regulator